MTQHAVPDVSKSRLQALKNKHVILSNRIEEARKSPSTTDFYINQLKKQKLLLKEEIEGIRDPISSVRKQAA